jgi:protein-disulfide isomerase
MFLKWQTSRDIGTSLKLPFTVSRDHFLGLPESHLEIVEYGDFQCSHCGEIYSSMRLLRGHFGDQLRFIFRHYPLPSVHPLSLEAALASEAAALHGRFWEMHDLIFENQRFLVRSSFSRFADEIGLNGVPYANSIGRRKLLNRVLDDFDSGLQNGVIGTPTLFINGERYNGFLDTENLYDACGYAIKADLRKSV